MRRLARLSNRSDFRRYDLIESGGIRTHTPFEGQRLSRPLCLPVPPRTLQNNIDLLQVLIEPRFHDSHRTSVIGKDRDLSQTCFFCGDIACAVSSSRSARGRVGHSILFLTALDTPAPMRGRHRAFCHYAELPGCPTLSRFDFERVGYSARGAASVPSSLSPVLCPQFSVPSSPHFPIWIPESLTYFFPRFRLLMASKAIDKHPERQTRAGVCVLCWYRNR